MSYLLSIISHLPCFFPIYVLTRPENQTFCFKCGLNPLLIINLKTKVNEENHSTVTDRLGLLRD